MKRVTLACAFLLLLFSARASATVLRVQQNENLQNVLDAAQRGDTIILDAGTTYRGPIRLRNKTGTGWIIIRSAAFLPSSNPLTDVVPRVSPSDAANMATIITPGFNPAIRTDPSASFYQIIGVEIRPENESTNVGTAELVSFGDGSQNQNSPEQVPHDLILDRCYIHGFPTQNVQRGVGLNSGTAAVVNCYISDIHLDGADSQGIAGGNGPGPYDVINNYVEAAGENIFFGGGPVWLPGNIPSHINVRGNYLYKQPSWHHTGAPFCPLPGEPTTDFWVIKNLFELKSAIDVHVEGNVMENSWGCKGYGAINLTVRNDGNGAHTTIQDVFIRNNIVRHASLGINILGFDSDGRPSVQGHDITVSNNLFEDLNRAWGDEGKWIRLFSMNNLTLNHNTAIISGTNTGIITLGSPTNNAKMTGFNMTNNIVTHGSNGISGPVPSPNGATVPGENAIKEQFDPSLPPIDHNVIIGGDQSLYPSYAFPINFWPENIWVVGFLFGSPDYLLASNSPYKRMASDLDSNGNHKDIGVDFAALEAATRLPTAPASLSADSYIESAPKLHWVDNSANEDGFKIELSKSNGWGLGNIWTEVGSVGAGVTVFALNKPIACNTRFISYRVRAFNSAGNSNYSNWASPCWLTNNGLTIEDVVWTNISGVTASGSSIFKSIPSYYWDAGAVSTRSISSGNGYVEITPDNAGTYRMFGLSNGDSGPVFTDIDFALSLGEGSLAVYENGIYRGQVGTYAAGDRLRVAVESSVVKYYKNETTLLYTSTVAPTYPLLLDTSISTGWGNVTNAKIAGDSLQGPVTQPVVWANLSGCTPSGNNLYKSNQSYFWDAGAVSSKAIASGDGYVEMTPDNAGTYRMFGLGNGDSSPVFTDIEFALALGEGSLAVYESGEFRGQVGTYVAGDKLRVAVEGGVVKYYKNGTLLYTSTVAPTYPLLFDTSISTSWGNVTNAYISGTLTP